MNSTIKVALRIVFVISIILNIQLIRTVEQKKIDLQVYKDYYQNPKNNKIKFVWNDDEESIPVDGSLITLESTDENTIYIGPYDANAKTN